MINFDILLSATTITMFAVIESTFLNGITDYYTNFKAQL